MFYDSRIKKETLLGSDTKQVILIHGGGDKCRQKKLNIYISTKKCTSPFLGVNLPLLTFVYYTVPHTL